MDAKATEPWTGWEPTVEADPVDSDELQSARARAKVLLDAVDAHYVAEQKTAGDWHERAVRWAVALEQRLAEVRAEIVKAGDHGTKYGDLRSRLAARLLALIDTPLGEPFAGYFTGRSSESA